MTTRVTMKDHEAARPSLDVAVRTQWALAT